MNTRPLGAPDEPEDRFRRVRAAIEIITTGHIPEQPKRLTRRIRQIVVATDQWDNHATVWFVRTGHSGEPVDENIHLERDGNDWNKRGGGGGAPGANLEKRLTLAELATHPSQRYPHTQEGQISFGFVTGSSWSPGHATIQFQTITEAVTLTFTDREPRQVADHGYCLVVYTPDRPPTITALDAQGNTLGSFSPICDHPLPDAKSL